MATSLKNLSVVEGKAPSAKGMKFAIVVSVWNNAVTEALAKGAAEALVEYGANEEDIIVKSVPGAFELTLGAQIMAENTNVDAVICLGCVIRGETPHFDYICQSATQGITRLNMAYNMPFIFGLLTTETMEQAEERAGGRYGNKGTEAAVTAIRMVALRREMETEQK
ncbi:MAG: 6,7-dimethyl-8-ribityllumazine synthase [Prevotellaceae bacterium]|jgi:6,7-dimethyl-8-ribityllumazine synthase|nr:6,7-dimethyl-8-ribityllumazine synthase [Prevotellaceae bacterium]